MKREINYKFISRNPRVNWQSREVSKNQHGFLYCFMEDHFKFLELNEMATLIWSLCDGKKNEEKVVDLLSKKLSMNEDQKQECRNFIEELLKRELLFRTNKKKKEKNFVYTNRPKKFVNPRIVFEHIAEFPQSDQNLSIYLHFQKNLKNTFPFHPSNFNYYPIVALIDITLRCNLSCRFCLINKSTQQYREIVKNEPSVEKIKNMIDRVTKTYFPRIIDLFGGEPFMRKDIFEIIEYVQKKGRECQIATSGTLFDKNKITKLIKFKPLLRINLWTEMDRETFRRAVKNVELLVRGGVPIGFNFVLHKKSWRKLPKAYRLAKKLKIKTFNIIPYVRVKDPTTNKALELTIFHQIFLRLFKFIQKINSYFLKHKTAIHLSTICNASYTLSIDLKGNSYLCASAPRNSPFGNIFKQNFVDVWHSKRRRELLNSENYGEPCKSCFFRKKCSKGCRAEIYINTGNFFVGNPYCFRGKISQGIRNILNLFKIKKNIE